MRAIAILSILISAVISTQPALAEKYAVIIGGSGEDFKEKNFFLPDFERFNNSLKKRGFKVEIVFDRAKTEGKFEAITATNKNIQSTLDDVIGKGKEGDQVIIVFHTHGSTEYWGVNGHPVLTESGHYDTGALLPLLRKTKAEVAVTDLSCYSGRTQDLIAYDKKAQKAFKEKFKYVRESDALLPHEAGNICIMTAASQVYVSICSGDPTSNSFTGALLEEFEKPDTTSLEEIFKAARSKDRSFTNLPQISSNPTAINSRAWDTWFHGTDPAGLADNNVAMEAQPCVDCESRRGKVIDNKVDAIAKTLGNNSVHSLMISTYRDAVKKQDRLNSDFAEAVRTAFKELTSNPKYAAYKNWDYSKVMFFSDLHNVPSLKFNKDGTVPKETPEFLQSFGYFPHIMKVEMMLAMNSKETLGQFVNELNAKIAVQQKARDKNREVIKNFASKILEAERKQYLKNFRSEKGNACRKFRL